MPSQQTDTLSDRKKTRRNCGQFYLFIHCLTIVGLALFGSLQTFRSQTIPSWHYNWFFIYFVWIAWHLQPKIRCSSKKLQLLKLQQSFVRWNVNYNCESVNDFQNSNGEKRQKLLQSDCKQANDYSMHAVQCWINFYQFISGLFKYKYVVPQMIIFRTLGLLLFNDKYFLLYLVHTQLHITIIKHFQ